MYRYQRYYGEDVAVGDYAEDGAVADCGEDGAVYQYFSLVEIKHSTKSNPKKEIIYFSLGSRMILLSITAGRAWRQKQKAD